MSESIIKVKYGALFILHALGDTIGFKNADWEFNYNKETDLSSILEFVYEFIELGGVNGIDLSGWLVSDDTLYHMAISNGILGFNGTVDDDFILLIKNMLITIHNRLIDEEKKDRIIRYPGKATEKYIEKFTEKTDGRTYPYDPMTGGNGAAMRNLSIGLAFYDKDSLQNLIDVSIISSKLTHNSPSGFLAGFTSAYFVSLAISNIPIEKWPIMLLELLESDMIKKHIDYTKNEIVMDYMMYIRHWKKYVDTRFPDGKPLKTKVFRNLIFRIRYYYENFVRDTKADFVGGSGFCAMIMAYDSLLDCDGKWEKLIFYAILHPGDSDTIGAIAGGLYGAMYGFGDVPASMLEHLEGKLKLDQLGTKFYDKFVLRKEVSHDLKLLKRSK